MMFAFYLYIAHMSMYIFMLLHNLYPFFHQNYHALWCFHSSSYSFCHANIWPSFIFITNYLSTYIYSSMCHISSLFRSHSHIDAWSLFIHPSIGIIMHHGVSVHHHSVCAFNHVFISHVLTLFIMWALKLSSFHPFMSYVAFIHHWARPFQFIYMFTLLIPI